MIFQKKFFYVLFLIFLVQLLINQSVLADELPIYSPAAILIDAKSGDVFYEKNSNSLMYPASTTKVLTAIIALESCSLDEKVTAGYDAVASIKSGYTNAKIQPYEQLTMEDLLYALLLKSGNEAANIIAEHIGGSIENFANLMNAKAIELGCTNTHFVNANGIHDDNHYTTASDLAKITRYCMQNQTFRHMVSTLTYTLPATEQYPSADRVLTNTNSLMMEGNNYYYPYAIGIKTGFTTQAKNCLIAASKKDDVELISIVLHAESTEDGRSARYLDTINLLEYGNNHYHSYTLVKKDQILHTIDVANATKETKKLDIVTKDEIAITLPNSEQEINSPQNISIQPDITAPIEAGSVLGTVTYVINDKNYTSDLVAKSDVVLNNAENISESSPLNFMMFVYILLALIIIRLFLVFFKHHIIIYRAEKLKKRAKKYLNP